MAMLVIYATIDIKESWRAKARTEILEFHKVAVQEPGCLDYIFASDLAVPGRIHVYERWESDEAMAAHMANDHSTRFAKLMNEMAESVKVQRYTVGTDDSTDFTRRSHELMGDSVQTT